MKKVIRLKESDLVRIVKRVISEQSTPQEWKDEIRKVEREIGHPSTWTMDGYNKLQAKLNEYKKWRETTPEGQAVVDYHNEPNEYVVQLPDHLKNT